MKKIDFFPYVPSIVVGDKYGHHTLLGAIITILLGLLTLLAIGAFGRDVIYKTNPNSLSSETYIKYPTLDKDEINVSLAVGYSGGAVIPNLDKKISVFYGFIDLDGSRAANGSASAFYQYFPAVKCLTDTNIFSNNTNSIIDFLAGNPGSYYCKPPGLTRDLEGKYGSGKFVSWDIRVTFCVNSTLNNYGCLPIEDIKADLAAVFSSLIVSTNLIDPMNNTMPIHNTYYSTIVTLSSKMNRQEIFFFNLVDLTSDDGFLLQEKTTYNSFQYDRRETDSIQSETPAYLLRVIVSLNTTKKNLFRSYMKVQKVAADTGGIIKFFLIILFYFNFGFAKISFLRYLKKRLVEISRIEHLDLNFKFSNHQNILDNIRKENTLIENENLKKLNEANLRQDIKGISNPISKTNSLNNSRTNDLYNKNKKKEFPPVEAELNDFSGRSASILKEEPSDVGSGRLEKYSTGFENSKKTQVIVNYQNKNKSSHRTIQSSTNDFLKKKKAVSSVKKHKSAKNNQLNNQKKDERESKSLDPLPKRGNESSNLNTIKSPKNQNNSNEFEMSSLENIEKYKKKNHNNDSQSSVNNSFIHKSYIKKDENKKEENPAHLVENSNQAEKDRLKQNRESKGSVRFSKNFNNSPNKKNKKESYNSFNNSFDSKDENDNNEEQKRNKKDFEKFRTRHGSTNTVNKNNLILLQIKKSKFNILIKFT